MMWSKQNLSVLSYDVTLKVMTALSRCFVLVQALC